MAPYLTISVPCVVVSAEHPTAAHDPGGATPGTGDDGCLLRREFCPFSNGQNAVTPEGDTAQLWMLHTSSGTNVNAGHAR